MKTILASSLSEERSHDPITRRRFTLLMAVLGGAATSMAWPCRAESFPDRPIKIVVPFAPGGPTDVVARLIGQSMASRLGKSVLIDNLAGAGGRIGAKAAAGAPADGYTLLLGGTNVNAMLGAIYKDLGFDPAQSFVPVAAICTDSMALGVNPDLPARTLKELIDSAKSSPGKLKYGAPQGIYTHFAGEFFKIKTGTDILFIPYKGGAPAMNDVIAGHIDMIFNPKSTLLPQFRAGKLRALAVTTTVRSEALPDLPTVGEFLQGYEASQWYGVGAPKNTSTEIVDKLNREINAALADPKMKARLADVGGDVLALSPADFGKLIAEETDKWGKVVKFAGIKAE
jgi:tripartite-type tricarboxylate transporter receptor subunit TctC